MSRVTSRSPDAPLRANVRLLGEILGAVIAEQEGEAILRLEERIRLLARLGRRGDEGSSRALAETIAGLDVETQAVVLRAFTMYFHLANIAEQHHRVRRRHELEREGANPSRVARRGRCSAGGRGRGKVELRKAAARVSVEPVLTAHPRGAAADDPREAPSRSRSCTRALDEARLPAGERHAAERLVAEEDTCSGRPTRCAAAAAGRRRDPAGALVLRAEPLGRAPVLVETCADGLAADRAAAVRKLDRRRPRRQPERRAEHRARGALERGAATRAGALRRDVRALARSWGISTTLVDADPRSGRRRA